MCWQGPRAGPAFGPSVESWDSQLRDSTHKDHAAPFHSRSLWNCWNMLDKSSHSPICLGQTHWWNLKKLHGHQESSAIGLHGPPRTIKNDDPHVKHSLKNCTVDTWAFIYYYNGYLMVSHERSHLPACCWKNASVDISSRCQSCPHLIAADIWIYIYIHLFIRVNVQQLPTRRKNWRAGPEIMIQRSSITSWKDGVFFALYVYVYI